MLNGLTSCWPIFLLAIRRAIRTLDLTLVVEIHAFLKEKKKERKQVVVGLSYAKSITWQCASLRQVLEIMCEPQTMLSQYFEGHRDGVIKNHSGP